MELWLHFQVKILKISVKSCKIYFYNNLYRFGTNPELLLRVVWLII